ncbi:IS1182 family transposase [Streptomyces sp. NBC_00006]|uniref:IS1182 family transposase n=1 Tax=Streptomyces sp. NBC_00006 TaxID=2975619 RepID=UPI00224F10F2|nr:IS1182 family transposase [Streptomyces sp. NBC_00006]MCX5529705.1 IS1182 family transposase [Streptomyces sp. NBC_00006]
MVLHPADAPAVPDATARVARAAFPKGCLAMRVRDELDVLFRDVEFVAAFPVRGGPGLSPGMLAMVSVMQFAERLTDRQAAEAVRGRIDWKYLLGLELEDTGFHFSVLSGFRERLVAHGQEERILDLLLERLGALGYLRVGGRVRTDSTHVLALARELNRLEFVVETLRCALEALTVATPGWLRGCPVVDASWQKRYGPRADTFHLPREKEARAGLGHTVGVDGFALLEAVHHPKAAAWLRELPAVQVLRQVWVQHYERTDTGGRRLEVRWREVKELPPGTLGIVSPFEPDARCSVKRDTVWHGYKVHYSESCDDDLPHLIVAVATTPAPADDSTQLAPVHEMLERRGVSPGEHFVDGGYTSAALILAARADGIDLVGPLPPASDRQTREGRGFALADFQINWQEKYAVCPTGAKSRYWGSATTPEGQPRSVVVFPDWECRTCKVRELCTNGFTRRLTLHPREEHELLQQQRAEQATSGWRQRYGRRAGVEGAIHQAVHTIGIRTSRYRGLARTSLAHILSAAALDLHRIDAHLTGHPLAASRHSHFAGLRLAA